MSLYSGELVSLMGTSGAGKSTLMKLIAGRVDAHCENATVDGSIIYLGEEAVGYWNKLLSISFVRQFHPLGPEEFTCIENIYFFARRTIPNGSHEELLSRIGLILKKLGMEKFMHTHVGKLSGGQKKLLQIAKALVGEPKVLLLDEPTSGLDSKTSKKLIEVLKHNSASFNTCIVVCIHQPAEDVFQLFDRLIVLNGGRIMWNGKPQESRDYFKKSSVTIRLIQMTLMLSLISAAA